MTPIAELNNLEIWGTNVGNTYLESKTYEKVVFVAGDEFRPLAGHLFQIVKARTLWLEVQWEVLAR